MALVQYNPKKVEDKWYAFDGKRRFKDWNGEYLEFLSEEECKLWCDTRNDIEEIYFRQGI